MKRFCKIYVEISNLCNLHCNFCPGTKRSPGRMNADDFTALLPKLKPYTDFLYFHVMGEPLCHPQLEQLLALAADAGFRVILTTNGTLLPRMQDALLRAYSLHKVNISLHAFEANDLPMAFDEYLQGCCRFAAAAAGSKIITFRLWNHGGCDELNGKILDTLHQHFPGNWVTESRGTRIGDRIYLEFGEKFDWPDLGCSEMGNQVFCYGLRDQLGILCDGTVIPCCLDHEGDIALGNIFSSDLDAILNSPRAKAIYDGFSRGIATEELCRKCGYARRFQK